MEIIKRDGRKEKFDREKIANAIFKAAEAAGGSGLRAETGGFGHCQVVQARGSHRQEDHSGGQPRSRQAVRRGVQRYDPGFG